jgi:hypothetical protein
MSSSPLRSTTLALLLATLLTASWAAAAGPQVKTRAQAPAAAPLSLLSRAWSLLASLWAEEGCNLDPNGRYLTGPVQVAPPRVDSDTGCHLDPDGRCIH